MVAKTTGDLVVMAILAMGLFAGGAQAEEPLGASNFLVASSPLEPGSLTATRGGVGVDTTGETDEARRRLGEQRSGGVSGAIAPLTRTRSLPSTRSASRTTDVKLTPAFVRIGTLLNPPRRSWIDLS